MPDTLDHTTGESSGALWEAQSHVWVQPCTDSMLQAWPFGDLKDPLTSCSFNTASPNVLYRGQSTPQQGDGTGELTELSADAQSAQCDQYKQCALLVQVFSQLNFLHLPLSNRYLHPSTFYESEGVSASPLPQSHLSMAWKAHNDGAK